MRRRRNNTASRVARAEWSAVYRYVFVFKVMWIRSEEWRRLLLHVRCLVWVHSLFMLSRLIHDAELPQTATMAFSTSTVCIFTGKSYAAEQLHIHRRCLNSHSISQIYLNG